MNIYVFVFPEGKACIEHDPSLSLFWAIDRARETEGDRSSEREQCFGDRVKEGRRMGSEEMVRFFAVSVMVVLTMGAFLPAVHAQAPSPAPTSDGVAIDQGVAYVLLFAALVVTYVVHPLDAFPFNLF